MKISGMGLAPNETIRLHFDENGFMSVHETSAVKDVKADAQGAFRDQAYQVTRLEAYCQENTCMIGAQGLDSERTGFTPLRLDE